MERKPLLSEDWTSVLLAFTIIAITIFGFKSSLPPLAWKNNDDLSALISDGDLWFSLLTLFVFGLIVIAVAFLLRAEKLSPGNIGGYAFLFMVTLVAQWITGNSTIKDFGLEIVL